jgi:peroxiredoxin
MPAKAGTHGLEADKMITRRTAATFALAMIAAGSLPTLAAADAIAGKAAPDFTLADARGNPVTLSGFRGKTVVIEWTNPECPFVGKHYTTGNIQSLQNEVRAAGGIWLTISSAAKGNAGYMDELDAQAFVEERKAAPTAFLFDRDASLLKTYGVQVALTFFVVDPKGTLAYAGAIDDRPTANPADVPGARNYVRDAVAAVARGETPRPQQTRAYGCTPR